jgi:hypothetical protein
MSVSLFCKRPWPNYSPEDDHPRFIYSYKFDTDKLWKTDLTTGEQSCHRVPFHRFMIGCSWSELPTGRLLIAGGVGHGVLREVVKIDTAREFAISAQPSMLVRRSFHAAVCHKQYVYVLGGYSGNTNLSQCEIYAWEDCYWEQLPGLPTAARSLSGVVVKGSLYALGSHDTRRSLLIQILNLGWHRWSSHEVKLDVRVYEIASYKQDAEVYFVVRNLLYCLQPTTNQPHLVKALADTISSSGGPSYCRRNTLYYSSMEGPAHEVSTRKLDNFM